MASCLWLYSYWVFAVLCAFISSFVLNALLSLIFSFEGFSAYIQIYLSICIYIFIVSCLG